jgi:hypothetical protein
LDEDQAAVRRPWRRRRPASPGRRPRLTVEYTDDEWARVQELAAAASWSVGAWVARRSLDPGDAVTQSGADTYTEAALVALMRAQADLGRIGNNLNQVARAVNGVIAAARSEDPSLARLLARLAAATGPLPALCEDLRAAAIATRDAVIAVSSAVRRRRRQ